MTASREQLEAALAFCRAASLNPFLRDLIMPRWSEILVVWHQLTGNRG